MTATRAAPTRRRPIDVSDLHLLRYVPGDSPVHRLWAGTKLVAVVVLSLVLSLRPTWAAAGLAGLPVVGAILLARIPRGAAPRLPRWFVLLFLVGGVMALVAGGKPEVDVGPLTIGFAGLDAWARFTVLALVFLVAAALVGWTTPMGEVAPAVSSLARPLRWLRLPVDEWVAALALAVRCLPLLADELRLLFAARRLRAPVDEPAATAASRRRGGAVNAAISLPYDLLAAALVVAIRRAGELGAAIEARGGLGAVADSPARPGRVDAVALAIVAAIAAAVLVLG